MEHIKKFNELWIQDQFKRLVTKDGEDTEEAKEILSEISGEYLNPLSKSDINFTTSRGKLPVETGMTIHSYDSYEFKYGSRICVVRRNVKYVSLGDKKTTTYSTFLSEMGEPIDISNDKMDITETLSKTIFNKVEKIYKK